MEKTQHPVTPYYIIYEDKLRRNLKLLKDISKAADITIIMAFKANALWKSFPIIKEYFTASTASSLNEMKLSLDFLGDDVHTYCPVYTENTFPEFLAGSSHITFNSLTQFYKFYPLIKAWNNTHPERHVSAGLRINPKVSVIETDIYNPCVPGSRFGEKAENLANGIPEGIEGLHFHALCESNSDDLEKILEEIEHKFGHILNNIKWLNCGGGHLMTAEWYDTGRLISLMKRMHAKYPDLRIILEPGSAFTWQTGDLVTTVLDIVEDDGIRTAIIDASFACHMPDTLEMPYQPEIENAIRMTDADKAQIEMGYSYRLGGNSCLSGDFVGDWIFPKLLKSGDVLTLKDMNHYTTVKTTMFNGIQHPSIWLQPTEGKPVLLRQYSYEDYKSRMD